MPSPENPFGDLEIARQVEEIRAQLASLASSSKMDALPNELAAIRETLRRIAGDNAELRRKLAVELGLRIDEDAPQVD
jgi:DNA repair ATPase RecN